MLLAGLPSQLACVPRASAVLSRTGGQGYSNHHLNPVKAIASAPSSTSADWLQAIITMRMLLPAHEAAHLLSSTDYGELVNLSVVRRYFSWRLLGNRAW
jgi:hypothetical protein